MCMLVNITGQRGSGKTTKARELVGEEHFFLDGYNLAKDPFRLGRAPSDKPWLVDGERMTWEDWRVLEEVVRRGGYLAEVKLRFAEQRKAPPMIVVDNYQFVVRYKSIPVII